MGIRLTQMKKLISIKEVRNLIAVTVMLIAFLMPLFIIESIGFPRLVSGWFSVVIGLLTTAAISNWNTDYGTESEQPFSQVLTDLRESIYMINMCVIIFYFNRKVRYASRHIGLRNSILLVWQLERY